MGKALDANKSFHLIPSFTTLNISHFILQPTDGMPESEFNAGRAPLNFYKNVYQNKFYERISDIPHLKSCSNNNFNSFYTGFLGLFLKQTHL